ncbi:MAG: hypothetical protein HQL69_00910 [Magnetococcales bacterium]|nr:hypothetical protein [Magnetococcales bacterium]
MLKKLFLTIATTIICIFLQLATHKNAEATFKLCIDLVEKCNSHSTYGLGLCFGYLEGIADKGIDGVCMPEDTISNQLKVHFLKWSAKNPKTTLLKAPFCVTEAMLESFPCK